MKEFLERAAKGQTLSSRDLSIVLDALPIPLSWADLHDGRIQFVNRAFKTLFGYSDDAFATVDDWIDRAYVNDDQKQEARRRWQQLWTPPASGAAEVGAFEVDVLCADGRIRPVQHRGILLHDIGIGIATFEDISDRKIAETALHQLAFEDALTRLPNRRALKQKWLDLANPKQPSQGVTAILVMDIDGFKSVNDHFGHDTGDALLQAIAQRLLASVRAHDLICRLGGDEFVALIQNLAHHDHVAQICWRIESGLKQPILINSRKFVIGVSIGASLFPQDGDDLQELLKRADEALYRVKTSGKGGWQWFEEPRAKFASS